MYSLRSLQSQHKVSTKDHLYLLKESSTHEKKLIYHKGTASSVVHGLITDITTIFQMYKPTTSTSLSKPVNITSDESDEIIIVSLREIPREYAKIEISEYIQRAGRKVYISELAEKLRLDIEMIMDIMEELQTETRE